MIRINIYFKNKQIKLIEEWKRKKLPFGLDVNIF